MKRPRLPEFSRLTWQDVDPAGRDFDPATIRALVRSLPPVAAMPPADADRRLASIWFDHMVAALVERLGDWVVGWRYTLELRDHEGRGRIPIWLTSLPMVTTPDDTLDRLATGIVAFHELTVELATGTPGRFAAAAPGPDTWQAVRAPGITRYVGDWPPPRVPHPTSLTWADVDVTGRDFDPATVPGLVAALVAASEIPDRDDDSRLRDLWLDIVAEGIVERYGPWVTGWRWSVGEGDFDGGPVGNWCCFGHSVGTPEATTATIVAAVLEWHDFLADLAGRFDRFLPMPDGDPEPWERAVAHLITAVGDRTEYESGWYSCCTTVLRWFLEAAGVEESRRGPLIGHAVGGSFSSWVEPKRKDVRAVAERFAERVTGDA
ncbi:hypothetical protein KZ829_15725 [Actinoplanes hulinensis]|uniref:Uncharacterized protein n=1 Tax=Actinoplanes hulinensis TaxID=1144547 RepID=A0ABS7B444_9ACTN|nr:hypothetical protein [Actinoplanes hulinensis]MBW6435189.1 hypothetical protein [Actinoplanes hulinensis]